MTGIQDALADKAAMKPGNQIVYTQLAKKRGVDCNTLSRAHRGVQVPRRVANEN